MAKKREGWKKIRFLWGIVVVFFTILGILGVTLFPYESLFEVSFRARLLGLFTNGNGKDEKKKEPDIPHTALDVAIINHIGDDGQMDLIPEGTFRRRSHISPSEWPINTGHTVHVDEFYMDRYEVTNAQYKKFIDANPQWQKNRIQAKYSDGNYLEHWTGNDYPKDRGNYPVTNVSWYAAMAYARSVGKRLPTEAEWEKAAWHPQRVGVGTIEVNETSHDSARIAPVGGGHSNRYGLFDLTTNVGEWCLDEYDADFYKNSRSHNPFSGDSLTDVVHNFTNLADRNAKKARVFRGITLPDQPGSGITNRRFTNPTASMSTVGFRCVRPVTP